MGSAWIVSDYPVMVRQAVAIDIGPDSRGGLLGAWLSENPHAKQSRPDDRESYQDKHPHVFFFHGAFSFDPQVKL